MPPFLRSKLLDFLPHGFFSRCGGVSHPPFDSLNVKFDIGDSAQHVAHNRGLIQNALGGGRLVFAEQTHSVTAIRLASDAPPSMEGDALISTEPGTIIGVLTADCVPVLLAHTQQPWIAAIHAGWRGATGLHAGGGDVGPGILENTLQYAPDLKHMCAVIGPCIHQASYEVSLELKDKVGDDRFFQGRLFDLLGYVVHRLRRAGVEQIESMPYDTFTDLRFFSHRRSAPSPHGRQASVIMLPR